MLSVWKTKRMQNKFEVNKTIAPGEKINLSK